MRSGLIRELPGPGAVRYQRIQVRAHPAVGITVPILAKERLVARHATAQPLASGVSKGTGTLRVDPVPVGKLLQVYLRHALYRLADLIRHGAQPILKTVVFAHAQMLAGDVTRPFRATNSGLFPTPYARDDRPLGGAADEGYSCDAAPGHTSKNRATHEGSARSLASMVA
jgi:hypothetical protein